MSNEQLFSIADVAKQLGSTELNVLMHIKRGLLNGQEIDEEWFVPQSSLEQYLADHKGKSDVCEKKTHCGGCGGGSATSCDTTCS